MELLLPHTVDLYFALRLRSIFFPVSFLFVPLPRKLLFLSQGLLCSSCWPCRPGCPWVLRLKVCTTLPHPVLALLRCTSTIILIGFFSWAYSHLARCLNSVMDITPNLRCLEVTNICWIQHSLGWRNEIFSATYSSSVPSQFTTYVVDNVLLLTDPGSRCW